MPSFSVSSKPSKTAHGGGVAIYRYSEQTAGEVDKPIRGRVGEAWCTTVLHKVHNSPHSMLIGKRESTVRLPPSLWSFSIVSSTSSRNLRICGFHLRNPINSTAKSCFIGFTKPTCGRNNITVKVKLSLSPHGVSMSRT